ncbi:GNAT family N-acetyltransferase [Prosthecomicrobium pneumaticum]|uniref:GNAT superfamily N-acetyltransferase n=1 Tax=Prosthecomicrobium pneumaticum TaxID=81895 RepID=A0A7W9FQM4_9HYPH|nr:GNAT family N-acetyltransferase [Prosthecomicrobium pneumaticum]MBB5755025.1 GNAT superfamily N-acetyltransferase [Prosthecomicrobium pneumaticum]
MTTVAASIFRTAMPGTRYDGDWSDDFDPVHYSRTVLVYYGLPEARIRNVTPADFPELATLQVRALLGASRETLGALTIKRYVERYLRQTFALCRQRNFFVAEIGERLVASGGWTRVGTGALPCAVGFFVAPEQQKRGFGRSLLAVAEATAHHAAVGSLAAFAPRDAARLFQKAGWRSGIVTPVDLGQGTTIDLVALNKTL